MTLEQVCPSEYQRAQCAFKDSMTHWNSAIRITYRISLRSSSMPEPRDPLLKVLLMILRFYSDNDTIHYKELSGLGHRRAQTRGRFTVPRRSQGRARRSNVG